MSHLFPSSQGRLNRRDFALGLLCDAVVAIIPLYLATPLNGNIEGTTSMIVTCVALLCIIAVLIVAFRQILRRLHDIGKSEEWCFLVFVPYLDVPVLLWLLVAKGTASYNKYGLPPTDRVSLRNILGYSPPQRQLPEKGGRSLGRLR